MRISELFKSQTSVDTVKPFGIEERAQARQKQGADNRQIGIGEDQVSISPIARQYAQIAKLLTEDEEAAQLRISELKQQVDNGTYAVEEGDVARAIASFARDSRV